MSIECRKTKSNYYSDQLQQTQTTKRTNQTSRQIHVAGVKGGKTRASKTRLVLVLLLIGCESGANFLGQSRSIDGKTKPGLKPKPKQITFDIQLKTALHSFRLAKQMEKRSLITFCTYHRGTEREHFSKILETKFSAVLNC